MAMNYNRSWTFFFVKFVDLQVKRICRKVFIISAWVSEILWFTFDRWSSRSPGIQYYLHMNNRSIDLFDPRCIEFNATLNTILLTHHPRISSDGSNIWMRERNEPFIDSFVAGQTVLSLVDEDLMYDVHQLGTLSPWALLTTLIYTYSKYFSLKNVDAHMAISFANFGKYSQWVRLTNAAPQGQQMNYLRFYAHNPGKIVCHRYSQESFFVS